MTGFEIAIFILGFALIVISFFIVGDKEKTVASRTHDALAADTAEELRASLIDDTTKKADLLLHETEDRLEAISNDKIMAVGEFSDQINEKIETNHKQVVFLYQMLTDKEKELRDLVTKIDNSRVECEKIIIEAKKAEEQKKEALAEDVIPEVPKTSGIAMLEARNAMANRSEAAPESVKRTVPEEAPAMSREKEAAPRKAPVRKTPAKPAARPAVAVGNAEQLDTGMLSRNDRIIELYKSKKSIMEISKLLGMGQGEVKLIIDLYCR